MDTLNPLTYFELEPASRTIEPPRAGYGITLECGASSAMRSSSQPDPSVQ